MKINQLKAGALLSYIYMGLGYLVSIIYTPIMLRLLGQSEYGLYSLATSIVSFLGVLNFGFGSTYTHYYLQYKVQDDKDKIATLNGMFLIIFSFIGVIAVMAGTIIIINADIIIGDKLSLSELSKIKILMFILVINLAFTFPNIVFTSHITANEKFVFQKLLQIVQLVANPFVILPVLLMGYSSIGMVIATTVLNLFIEIINIKYCLKRLKMKFLFNNFDFKLMKEMTIFSSYIFLNLVIDQINWNVDKLLIGRFHGTVSVAVYGVASQLNNYYMMISTAISSVFIPRVHRIVASSNDNKALTELFIKIGRLQFIILSLISTGLIFFGRPFINMWAGYNYDDSYKIVLILILSESISLIQNIGIEIQQAKNMHRFRSFVYFLIALVNIIISIPLTKLYKGIGAAFGTALGIIIGNGLIMNLYYYFKVGINIKLFWKQIIILSKALIIPVFAGLLINRFVNLYNILNFLCFGIIYVIIFCISMWFLGINQYEKDLFQKPIIKAISWIKNNILTF